MKDCTLSPRIVVSSFSKKVNAHVGNRSGKAFHDAQDIFIARKNNRISFLKNKDKIEE